MLLRVRPLVFPDGKRLDANAGLKQDIEGIICHGQLGWEQALVASAEQHGNIGVAMPRVITPCATAEEHQFRHVVLGTDPLGENAQGSRGRGVKLRVGCEGHGGLYRVQGGRRRGMFPRSEAD